jgi:hypothetical protein
LDLALLLFRCFKKQTKKKNEKKKKMKKREHDDNTSDNGTYKRDWTWPLLQ